ncbi:hypothetical protein RHSIM_Rhsim02G0123800 [Rhododendron simsii]|uniref:Uncharacterized protein n=1 Tax=Rhododendron simsii TaxID=118357 RepID=A0A834LVX8_RHOSS|nr:hypothetical protein RHSIM_Rhsim02G0123800 [Rhododendron simsii]
MCSGEVMDEGATRDDLLNSEITDTASLEASFVKELHQSLGLLSSHSEYSDQFTVLQDGVSRRINFERSQPLPYNAAGSHFVKESSWMQWFTCSGKHDNISVNLRECGTFCSEEMLSGRKRIFTHRLRKAMHTP